MSSNYTNPFAYLVDFDTPGSWLTNRVELEEELLNPFPIDFDNLPKSPDFSEEAPILFRFPEKEEQAEQKQTKASEIIDTYSEHREASKNKSHLNKLSGDGDAQDIDDKHVTIFQLKLHKIEKLSCSDAKSDPSKLIDNAEPQVETRRSTRNRP